MEQKREKKQERNLEEALKRMEEVIGEMENPDITLADSLKLYKEGVELASWCREAVEGVEKEIQILEEGEDASREE